MALTASAPACDGVIMFGVPAQSTRLQSLCHGVLAVGFPTPLLSLS